MTSRDGSLVRFKYLWVPSKPPFKGLAPNLGDSPVAGRPSATLRSSDTAKQMKVGGAYRYDNSWNLVDDYSIDIRLKAGIRKICDIEFNYKLKESTGNAFMSLSKDSVAH